MKGRRGLASNMGEVAEVIDRKQDNIRIFLNGAAVSKTSTLSVVIIALIWIVIGPLTFATLYSVLELQTAARAQTVSGAVKGDPRLAALQTIALAADLDRLDIEKEQLEKHRTARTASIDDVFNSRRILRSKAVEILIENGVSDARKLCTAPTDILNKCQLKKDMTACTEDYQYLMQCQDKALSYASGGKTSTADMQALRGASAKEMSITAAYNHDNRIGRQWFSTRGDIDNRRDKAAQNTLYSIAATYRSVSLPFFQQLFILPQGVVVACFTALMAAFGAIVSSLLEFMGSDRERSLGYISHLFITSPLLGALSGFLVYFVISAGAAFLVPGSLGGATDAVNNLSVPALASLGVFAGLAATSAIGWLRDKASTFFKTS